MFFDSLDHILIGSSLTSDAIKLSLVVKQLKKAENDFNDKEKELKKYSKKK